MSTFASTELQPLDPVLRFWSTLQESCLLGQSTLEDLRELSDTDPNPAFLAEFLVNEKLLTRWQADQLLAGRRNFLLGNFRLLDHIGSGHMGTVYRAMDRRSQQEVALKVMPSTLAEDDQSLQRFQREILALTKLKHPHIVASHGAETISGRLVLIMEYVSQGDLQTLLSKRGPVSIRHACTVAKHVARGLAHAHENGFVHRDVKPANILLGRDEKGALKARIGDLGLAGFGRCVAEARLTFTGQLLGSPDYMAPEQARDARCADHRSDIYSLGCTLFQSLTGKLPYEGTNVLERMMRRMYAAPRRAVEIAPAIPEGLSDLVGKMLCREPDDRFQTTDQVIRALKPYCR